MAVSDFQAVIFTSTTYLFFLAAMLLAYWSLGRRNQNLLLLVGSFVFYGFVTPWFCLLLATSIIVDFNCGKAIHRSLNGRKYLLISIGFNISLLAVFKYCNFFIENFIELFNILGFEPSISVLNIVLPVGISFYTFQTLSYTIDVYRGKLKPIDDFVAFSVFVSMFPQLVAGPIERATNMLPQILGQRQIDREDISRGVYLIFRGFVKKLVVADNVAIYVDKIFLLETANPLMIAVGSVGFGIQIYADFSAYTDIARGSARLFGFRLMENFRSPYLACSPSDFWRRWHISLSSWMRDYLYIPLRGSKTDSRRRLLAVLVVTMGLSGLWHGAAWNFVLWGLYHGLLLVIYHGLGFSGNVQPRTFPGRILAISIMFILTMAGWALFRTPSVEWLYQSLFGVDSIITTDSINSAVYFCALFAIFSLPLYLYKLPIYKIRYESAWILSCILVPLLLIVIFHQDNSDAFIYFQF
ncbi:MAG: MBOAT family protein [Gammaproteobacteria bacterium]|nr:MBOAT family protein [Gammaproteobacteria bacterium]